MAAYCRIEELNKYTIRAFVRDFNVTYRITNKQNGAVYDIDKPNSAFSIDEEVENLKLLLGD